MHAPLRDLVLRLVTMTLLVTALLYPVRAVAQDEATTAPVAKSELSADNLLAGVAESVDLASGSVALPVPLVSLAGRDGLDVSLTASYSSNVEATVRLPNATAPTGIMGVGWSLGHSRIVVDHKGTYHPHDNAYYLIAGGTVYELVKTGGSDLVREFKTSPLEFWRITYYYQDEKWKLVRNDGTIETYGDLNSSSDAVEQGIRWGNWIGDSATPGGQTYAFAWNISEIQSSTGERVQYEYFNYREKVGSLYVHTKATYLERIIDSLGRTVTLHYSDKDESEYHDPHTGHPEVPAGGSGPGDAYQEYYETLYLDSLSVTSPQNAFLHGVSFSYNLNGPAAEPAYTKRYLTAITHYTGNGEALPPTEFQYLSYTHSWNPGALSRVITSTGAEASYTYQPLQISNSERTVIAEAPSGTGRPRVFIHHDYTIITWHNESLNRINIQIYEWDGEWLTSSALELNINENDGIQEFQIYTEDNFFVVRTKTRTRVFTRDPAIRGRWVNSSFSHQAEWDRGKQWVATGDDFFVTVHSLSPLVVQRLTWINELWHNNTINMGYHNNAFIHGIGNYFAVYNRDQQGWLAISRHRISYLEDSEWSDFVDMPSFPPSHPTPIVFSAAPGYIAMHRSNTGYIMDWDSDMNDFHLHAIGSISTDYPIHVVDNTTIGLGQSRVARRDGSLGWRVHDEGYNSVGQDFSVRTINRAYIVYDANHVVLNPSSSSGWQAPVTLSPPPDAMAHAGSGFLTLGSDVYRIPPNGSSPSLIGSLPVRNGHQMHPPSPRIGLGSFIAYNEQQQARTAVAVFDGERLISATNIQSGNDPLVVPGRRSVHTQVQKQEWSPLTGPHTVVTYPGAVGLSNFHQATDLQVHRVVRNGLKGPLSRPVVSRVTIDDGFEQRASSYTYSGETARLDPSGYVVRNAEVEVRVDNEPGYTTYRFYNGTVFGGCSSASGAPYRYDLHNGLLCHTERRSETNTLVESTRTRWETFSRDIGPRLVYWTRPADERVVTTGLVQEQTYIYDTDNDRVRRNTGWVRNASGGLDEVATEYTYASEKYGALEGANRMSEVAQTRTLVNGETVEATATTWWDGWSGMDAWLPRCSYVWTGEGPSVFHAWSDEASASESILLFHDAPGNGGALAIGSLSIIPQPEAGSENVTITFSHWSVYASLNPPNISFDLNQIVSMFNDNPGFAEEWTADTDGNTLVFTSNNVGTHYNGITPELHSSIHYFGLGVATEGGADADAPWPSEQLHVTNGHTSNQFEIELWGGRTGADIRDSVYDDLTGGGHWSQNYDIEPLIYQGYPALRLTANVPDPSYDLTISVTANNPFTVAEVIPMAAWPGSLVSTGNCPTVGNWQRVSKVVDRDGYGNVIEAENAREVVASTIWGHDGAVPIAEFSRADRASVAADDFRGGSLLQDDVQQWISSGSNWNLSDEALRWTSLANSGSLMLEQALDLDSFIAEYEYAIHPEAGWGTDGGLGFHFRAANSGHSPEQSGYLLKHFPDGRFELLDRSASPVRLLAQGQLERAVDRHRIRIAADGPEIRVFINDVEEVAVTDPSNPFGNNAFVGFHVWRVNGELAQFRLYPLDAVATSTTYHPDYLRVERTNDPAGAPTFFEYDTHGVPVETRRYDGLVLSQQSYLEPRHIHPMAPITQRSSYTRFFLLGNPVRNSSFELGEQPDGNPLGWRTWAPNGAVARVVTGSRQMGLDGGASFTGSHAMSLEPPPDGSSGTWYHVSSRLYAPDFLDAETSYTATFYLLAPTAGQLRMELFNHVNGYGYQTTSTLVRYDGSSAWQRIEADLTTGSQSGWSDPLNKRGYVSFRVPGGSAAILIDDVELRRSDAGSQNAIASADFLDASNRVRQTQLSEGTSLLISQQFYDTLGRNDVTTKPGRVTGATFSYRSDFAHLNRLTWQMSGQVASLYPQDAGRPYSRTVFETNLLGRPVERGRPGATHAVGGNSTTFEHFVNHSSDGITNRLSLPGGQYHGSTSIDADGNRSSSLIDGAGRTVAILGEAREALLATVLVAEAGDGICMKDEGEAVIEIAQDALVEVFVAPGVELTNLDVRLGSSPSGLDVWHHASAARIDTSEEKEEVKLESHQVAVSTGTLYLSVSADMVTEPRNSFCPWYRVTITYENPQLTAFRPLTSYEYDERGRLTTIRPPNFHNLPLGSVSAADFAITRSYDHFDRLVEETTPDAGTERFAYDRHGRLRFALDAQGAQGFMEDPVGGGSGGSGPHAVRYTTYDERNRVAEEGVVHIHWSDVHQYVDDPSWPAASANWRRQYVYFGDLQAPHLRGRLKRVVSRMSAGDVVQEEYDYDPAGRVSEVRSQSQDFVHEFGSVGPGVRYTWDAAGNVVQIEYPGSEFVVRYRYDAAGRLAAIGTPTAPEHYAAYTYTASGAMQTVALNDGDLTRSLAYDSPGRLTSIEYQTEAGPLFGQELSYESGGYDGAGYANGLIARSAFTLGWPGAPADYAVAYAYDSAGYLTAAEHTGATALAAHNIGVGSGNRSLYDPNGNPQRIILGAPGQQTERVYAYHARTNRVAGTTGTGVDYRYNASGNMTRSETAHADGRIDLTWDGFLNLPARVTHPGWDEQPATTHFVYGSSERVLKRTEEDGATTRTFYFHGLSPQPLYVGECIELTAGGGECWSTAYVWGPEGLLAERRVFGGPGVVERFAVKDHLGSIRLLVDAADETVYAWRDYAPFGALMRGEVTGDLCP